MARAYERLVNYLDRGIVPEDLKATVKKTPTLSKPAVMAVGVDAKALQVYKQGRSGAKGQALTPPHTLWKRFLESWDGKSGTCGCCPMMNSTSGMRLTTSWPFGPTASRRASRHWPTSASLFTRI